jgi:hypothetical protein
LSNTDPQELLDLLALCETASDFAEYDRMEAAFLASKQEQQKWTCTTLSEVAEFFGLNVQTVKQWRMESPPMPGAEGSYPLPAIVKWREDKFRNMELSAEKKRQEQELRQITIDRKKLDLEVRQGQLIERKEVERDVALIFARVKNRTDSLPAEVATLVPAEQKIPVKRLVEEKVKTMQKEMTEGEF